MQHHLQRREGTALMVIDIQTEHFPRCFEGEERLDTMIRVTEAARLLEVPLIVTEHYPKVFGQTVAALSDALGPIKPLPKMHFSCLGDPAIAARVEEMGVTNLVLIGSETHICVAQTALEAIERGLRVAVVADAVTGLRREDHEIALDRLRAHFVDVLTWQSLVYEWMRKGGTKEFKEILPLVKGTTIRAG